MRLRELLNEINLLAKQNGISQPWIVGGVPRDKALNRLGDFSDLDLTTGDSSIHLLGPLVERKFESLGAKYKIMQDGHSKILIGNFQLDLSSNFIVPQIEKYIKPNSTALEKELYSRDFFCNTLLMSTELNKIVDLTKQGFSDLKKKELRTCLSPEITFGYDPKRLVRAIYLAAKLDFDVEENTKNFIQQNQKLFGSISPNYVTKKILKAFKYNSIKTSRLLTSFGLWNYLPATEELVPFIQAHLLK